MYSINNNIHYKICITFKEILYNVSIAFRMMCVDTVNDYQQLQLYRSDGLIVFN